MKEIFIYLGIYLFILFAIVFYIRRKESNEDFLISGRNRNKWQIALSKFADAVGATFFITYSAYAYEYGWGILAAVFGLSISFIFFAYWAVPKIYEHSREKRFYTQGDYVFNRTGSEKAKILTNFVATVTQGFFLLAGIIGGAKVMSHFGLVSYEMAVLLSSGTILAYILLAGHKAVIITDVLQSIVIFVLLALMSYTLISDTNFIELVSTKTKPITPGLIISFLLYGLLSVFSSSQRYQLCYASKDSDAAKHGQALTVIPIFLVCIFIIFIGLFMYAQDANLDPDLAFLEAILNHLPTAVLPLALVMLFAGIMSSADTGIYAISSHFTFSFKKKDRKTSKRTIQITTLVTVIITTIISLIFRNVVGASILAAGFMLVISIAMIYLIAGKQNIYRFFGSTFGGFIGFLAGVFIVGIDPQIVATTLLGGLLGLLYNKRAIKS